MANLPDHNQMSGEGNPSDQTISISFDDIRSSLRLTNTCQGITTRPDWNLKWKNLYYKVEARVNPDNLVKALFSKTELNHWQLLNNVSGQVRAGEAVAIMGGSGAGKTTLLNALSGRLSTGELNGLTSLNGKRRDKSWKRIAAYVEQDDIMVSVLTVREIITFAYLLKISSNMNKAEKLANVEASLSMLGLLPVANSPIGGAQRRGISGGERKRVSIGKQPNYILQKLIAIGVELVTDPGVIFLDEPTSGLDSFTAQTVSDSIVQLAKADDRTILLTIHQPRMPSWNCLTKLFCYLKAKWFIPVL